MAQDESSTFEETMRGVVPLSRPNRAIVGGRTQTRSANRAIRRANASGELSRQQSNEFSDNDVVYLRPTDFVEWKLDGVQPKVFSMFQSGGYQIQKTLDLHKVGITRARDLVWNLIQRSIDLDFRCVRILHGRGEKSQPPAQLKSHVVHWLKQHKDVIALSTAPQHLGGTGAVLVKIRKGHKAKQDNRERFGG